MERYLEAKGSNAHVELLQDKVSIKHRWLVGGFGEANEIPVAQISSVRFKKPGLLAAGHIEFMLNDQEVTRRSFQTSQESLTIHFDGRQTEAFEAIRQAVEQPMEGRRKPAEVPVETPTEASTADRPVPTSAMPVSKVAGGVEVLGKKLRKLAEQNMGDDETVKFCLISPGGVGGWSQAIVALSDRLLVIKPGMAAGATFGARVTSFYYRDITGIEVNTGLMQGVIEINTPSYQGTGQKDFWNAGNKDKNPFHVTNCLPIGKRDLKHYKPYIDRLRTMIREAKQERPTSPPTQSGNSLSAELENLASLRASGVLTDEEFQQAKKRLLNQ